MKKLKLRLERKITDIFSNIALYCEWKGYFKISNIYRFPFSDKFYIEVTKVENVLFFMFIVILKRNNYKVCEATIRYDVFSEPQFHKAYTIINFSLLDRYNEIPELKGLLEELKNSRWKRKNKKK